MKLFFPHRFSFYALLLVCFLFQVQNAFAQAPLVKMWDKRFGGTDGDRFTSFQQTTDGGYILGGWSYSGITGDKTQPAWGTNCDFWIVKIDSLGIKQWDKRFGGLSGDGLISLQQTIDGGYILGGWTTSGIGGDKTQPVWGTSYDYWIVKIDSLGVKQWDKSFGGIYFDQFRALQQTTDGGYILGGYSNSGISGDKSQPSWGGVDYWIVKTNSNGIKQWDKDFGGTNDDFLSSLRQTTDGGYILGGESRSGIGGDKTQPSWGWSDYWIVKIDSLGIKQWDKRFGGTDDDWFGALQQTSDGGYILGGVSISGISGDKTQPVWGLGFDYWIVKIDSVGIKQWDKRFGGTANEIDLRNILQISDGGYLFTGSSYSQISGDKTESNLAPEQIWIVKTDSIGNKQWDKTLRTDSSSNIDLNGLAIQTNDGCYAMANCTWAGIGGDKTQTSWGNDDYWIIKFCDTTSDFIPSINLFSSDTTFCEKSCLSFFDLSTNNPTSWQWHFPGAQPDTSTLENPTSICYNNYGSYNVTLVACNQFGCDSITFSNFITCYQNPVDSIYGANDTLWSMPAVSYQWYETSTGIISGATNQFYVSLQLGSYFCVATDTNGCEANSNTIVLTAVPPLAFGEGQGVRIQPNPATDFISVGFSFSKNQNLLLEIFDVNGKVMLKKNVDDKNKTININSLAKGVYGYRIISNEKILQQGKLVKM